MDASASQSVSPTRSETWTITLPRSPRDRMPSCALREAVAPNNCTGALLDHFMDDPTHDLDTWMGTSKRAHPDAVGDLGTWLRLAGAAVEFHSAFQSAADALTQTLRPDFRFLMVNLSYDSR